MKTAKDIIERAGLDAVKARFDVKDRLIRHHAANNKLPAGWYAGLCDMTKQKLPLDLFSFKGMDI